MTTLAKVPLSGSTDGRAVSVAATSIGSGTTIHTAQASASLLDFVTLYATNSNTAPCVLTIGWGSTSAPDLIVVTIPVNVGLQLVVADLPIRNALIVKASADTASKVFLFGDVKRES